MSSRSTSAARPGPEALPEPVHAAITAAGCHPAIVIDLVANALANETTLGHLVHQETTLGETFRRHVSALVLTSTRLLVAHAEDHPVEQPGVPAMAMSSLEAVPLRRMRSVVVANVVANPQSYEPGALPDEVTLTLCWGTVQRLEWEPANCLDPQCNAEHGTVGQVTSDDMTVRITQAADGAPAVQQALAFAHAVNAQLAAVS